MPTNKKRIRRLPGERMFSILKEEAERQNVEINEYTSRSIRDLIDIDKTAQGRAWWTFVDRAYVKRFNRDVRIDRLNDELDRIDDLIRRIR